MIPNRTGNCIAACQVNSAAPSGCALTAASDPMPPAARTVPTKSTTAARIMMMPWITSVLTTEMKPPTAV